MVDFRAVLLADVQGRDQGALDGLLLPSLRLSFTLEAVDFDVSRYSNPVTLVVTLTG